MVESIAALGHLGIREEASFGSGGAINEYLPITSEDIQLVKSFSYQDRVMASAQQVGGRFMQEAVTGSITFPVSPQITETIWRLAVGGSASPYTPTRPLGSLALEIDREAGAVYCSGDAVGSLELSSEQGGELAATVSIEGKGYASVTPSSPSFTSGDDPYLHSEAVFEIEGVETKDVTAFSVSIDNQLQTGLYANQRQRRVIPATKVVVTGSFTKLFQDTDEYNAFLAQSEMTLQARYSRGAKSLTILINKARLDTWNAPLSGQTEYILETFNFTGFVDDPSSESVISIAVV